MPTIRKLPWQTSRPSPDQPRDETYETALKVLSRMRRGQSLTQAAAALDISPRTVRHYVGSALEQGAGNRWVAKPNDRLYRSIRFLDRQGLISVEPADAREASKVSSYWQAVDEFRDSGDDRELRRFARMRLRTRDGGSLPFVTDPDLLERLGSVGELSYEDFYEH